MRKLWILGALAAAVLVVTPVMVALAQGGAGGGGGGGGGKAGGGMGRGGVTLTDEQTKALEAPTAKLVDAIKAFQVESVKVLGDQDGKRYVMQAAMKAYRDLNPDMAGPGGAGGGKKGGGGAKGGAPAPGGA
jgi:hypothetical protein